MWDIARTSVHGEKNERFKFLAGSANSSSHNSPFTPLSKLWAVRRLARDPSRERNAFVYTLVSSARRLRLIGGPPFQEVGVGNIFHVRAEADASAPIDRITIEFEEHLLELIAGARTVEALPETYRLEVKWTFYAKAPSTDPLIIRIRAQAADLMQVAEVTAKITTHVDT